MKSNFLTVLGIAAGIAAIGATVPDANADRRSNGFHGGWHGGHDRHVERRHHRKSRGHYGFYSRDSFSPGCHRYLMKARWSGHRYWWRKYNRCIRAGD